MGIGVEFPIAYQPATVGSTGANASLNFQVNGNYFTCMTDCAQQVNHTPLFNYADTVSWTRGKHAFRGGVDFRFTWSKGYETPYVQNFTLSGAAVGVPGERGTVLRRANRGFNVPGGTTVAGDIVVPAGLFPDNWISANPQLNQANYYTNSGKSNYHSLQVQGTLRAIQGLTFQ